MKPQIIIQGLLKSQGVFSDARLDDSSPSLFQQAFYLNYQVIKNFDSEILAAEIITFILAHGLLPRRVCFLIETDEFDQRAAIILELVDVNLALFENNKPLQVKEVKANLKYLYRTIKCQIVADEKLLTQKDSWINALKILNTASQQITLIRTTVEKHTHLVFADYVLQLLYGKKLIAEDYQALYQEYHAKSLAAFDKQLEQYQSMSNAFYADFIEEFTVLLKYQLLFLARNTLDLQKNSLEEVKLKYYEYKKNIYAAKFDVLAPNIKRLSLDGLSALVAYSDDPRALLQFLKEQKIAQLNALREWESQFKQAESRFSWKNYGWNLLRKASDMVYQYTMIGLIAELSEGLRQWLGKKAFFQKLARLQTHYPQSLRFPLFKIIGGSIGLSLTISGGAYNAIRFFFINFLSIKLSKKVMEAYINDEKASCELKLPYLYTKKYYLPSAVSAGGAMLETICTGDYRYITFALGGLAGSAGVNAMVKAPTTVSRNVQPTMTNEQFAMFFLLSMSGYELGKGISAYLYFLAEKLVNRKLLEQAFCLFTEKQNYLGCPLEFLNSPFTLAFWTQRHEPVRLGYTFKNKFWIGQCDFNPDGKMIDCEMSSTEKMQLLP